MIKRYTRPEMGRLFAPERRFDFMLKVEVAVAKTQGEFGIIPKEAAKNIELKSRFDIDRIYELEKTTKHDVIAFVSAVAEEVGSDGRFIHYGMTSSDVLDTATSLQVQAAGDLLKKGLNELEKTLGELAREHVGTLCAGRTHGMHAEVTTFGLKMAGHLGELKRNHHRLERALEGLRIAKLSGAVGSYSTQDPKVELRVAEILDLRPEDVATQVIPRDRMAELICAIAILGAGIERLAVELRHLQRTEVSEVIEGFTVGQKGSSAMPHKKNPISAENLTGIARLLRSYAAPALEDVALWHERDISHSSVERVMLPDAFILCDYAIHRMNELLQGLQVNRERMLANMDLSQGQLFSSQVLLALVDTGMSREDAYKRVQSICHNLGPNDHLKVKIASDLPAKVVEDIFSGQKLVRQAKAIVERVLKQ